VKKILMGIAGFLLLLIGWVAGATYVRTTRTDLAPAVIERLYPLPQQIVVAAVELPPSEVWRYVRLSTYRVLLGFFAAAVVAVPVGFAIGRLRLVAEALEPANDFLRYLPVAGFTTLAIFLLGTGNASAILVVFTGTVFHLVVATADAARRVPVAYLDLARTMSFGPLRRFFAVVVPAASPSVFDNLRIAVGWAWSYVTLAEVMGAEGGLGHAIEVSRRYIRTDQVLVWIAIIGILGVGSDQVMRAFGRRWFRWAL
jgi:NitT/TauT family transport system permease protein